MSIRGQTGDAKTQFVVNEVALKAFRESQQFRLFTGKTVENVNCRTVVTFGGHMAQVVTDVTVGSSLALLLNHDWARFQELVKEWRAECDTASSPIEMAMCPAYQKVLAMGAPAVPLILRQLELEGDDPDHWFWALSYLTGEDPVAPEDRGNLRKMKAAWLRWGYNNLLVW